MRKHWRENLLGGWVRLNLRAATLALRGRWLDQGGYEAGYDGVAETYENEWLCHIRPLTEDLIARLPDPPPGPFLDLGCGTGGGTFALARRFPAARITGVDISQKMLDQARALDGEERVLWRKGDMLETLERTAPDSLALILSAWAIGYSEPRRVVHRIGAVLRKGGVFGFVVNRFDTLAPVNRAFRRTMARYPEKLSKAIWPRFPRSWETMEPLFRKAGLEPLWSQEGEIPLEAPDRRHPLSWGLKTGFLAGYDQALPLRDDPEIATCFEREWIDAPEPLTHRYLAATLRKV